MNHSRRLFLAGASLLALDLVAGTAFAQDAEQKTDAIGQILQSQARANWGDDFDAQASEGQKIASKLPIFSPQTVDYIQAAIAQYQQIVANGGWPTVPRAFMPRLCMRRPR